MIYARFAERSCLRNQSFNRTLTAVADINRKLSSKLKDQNDNSRLSHPFIFQTLVFDCQHEQSFLFKAREQNPQHSETMEDAKGKLLRTINMEA